MSDKIFAKGIYYDIPHPKAPSFVKGQIAIVVDQFIPFLQEHRNGDYVRLDIKESASTKKLYLELSTWEPGKKKEQKVEDVVQEEEGNQANLNNNGIDYPEEEINPDDIPF